MGDLEQLRETDARELAPVDCPDAVCILRQVFGTPWGRRLHEADPYRALHWLVAPLTLGKSIATLAQEFSSRRQLRILIGGAAFLDGFDKGAWYQMLPWLIGNNEIFVDIALVGYEASLGKPHSVTGFQPTNFKTGELFTGSLSDFMAQTDKEWDILMLFNPGFNAVMEWFSEPVINDFLDKGKPVLCASQSVFDVENDLYVLKFFGLGTDREPEANPFGLHRLLGIPHGTSLMTGIPPGFGEYFWRLFPSPARPHPDLKGLQKACHRIHMLDVAAQKQIHNIGPEAAIAHAEKMMDQGMPGQLDGHDAILLKEGTVLLRRTGEIYSLLHNAMVRTEQVPAAIIDIYPEPSDGAINTFPQRLYAEWIWQRYVAGR